MNEDLMENLVLGIRVGEADETKKKVTWTFQAKLSHISPE